jgi:hypothetical protein
VCIITIYAPMFYTYSTKHNILDAYISITRGSGRGLGLEFESFLGPAKWHRADRRVPFGAQKTRAPGCINHRCIGCFMHTSPLVTLTGCIVGRYKT